MNEITLRPDIPPDGSLLVREDATDGGQTLYIQSAPRKELETQQTHQLVHLLLMRSHCYFTTFINR
jgi:hypothetical protein